MTAAPTIQRTTVTKTDRRLAREQKAREQYAARMARLAEQAARYYDEVRNAHPLYFHGQDFEAAAVLTDDITRGARNIVERWGR